MFSLTPEGFVHVPITEEMVSIADQKAQSLGILRKSIRCGGGNLVGFLGEEICLRTIFKHCLPTNTYHHDFIMVEGENIYRFEVKSKQRKAKPQPDYDASIADYNATQKTDFYVFTSITWDVDQKRYTDGYITGMMSAADYKRQARFYAKGDIDPSNKWVVSADCHNVPYSSLSKFQSFFE